MEGYGLLFVAVVIGVLILVGIALATVFSSNSAITGLGILLLVVVRILFLGWAAWSANTSN